MAEWLLNERLPELLIHYGILPTEHIILQAYNLGAKAFSDGRRNSDYLNKYARYVNEINKGA